ncbi:MAG: OmpA family protein [Deltaproteobacteria bacterium]|nr:OmpA family protein [Deltaproteobacteria bacterium]
MFACLSVMLLAAPDAVTLQTKAQVFAGEGVPFVKVMVHLPIEGAVLRLKREDNKDFNFTIPKAKKGEFVFKLDQEKGSSYDYSGELEVRFKGGEVGTIPLEFRGEIIVPLEVATVASAKEIAQRKFNVKASRKIAKIDMTLIGEDGAQIGPVIFRPKEPSEQFVAEFPLATVPTVRIDAVFADEKGITRAVQLFPWYVEIAHEEVSFETNKFDVPKAEEQKLAVAYDRIFSTAEKAMKFAPVKLYVIGHTDTVGPADKNLTLSHKRAKSIATWFRKHGFSLPVVVAGLGESSLLKATPDETDEASNRRAQYVLTVDPPDLGRPVQWEKY